jgi:hypothetical protein
LFRIRLYAIYFTNIICIIFTTVHFSDDRAEITRIKYLVSLTKLEIGVVYTWMVSQVFFKKFFFKKYLYEAVSVTEKFQHVHLLLTDGFSTLKPHHFVLALW